MKTKEKTAFALDNTLSAYGIRKLPFPIEEADDFFFSTPMLSKQIDALRNLVEYSDLILVVSGVEGAGKTAFLNQFLFATSGRWRVCRVNPRTATTIDALVDALLEGFGIRARGEDAPGDEALLRQHLAELNSTGQIALAVVDDAFLLPQPCKEFLLGLAEERGRIDLRLLVTTQPGRLGIPTSDPQRMHVIVLQPFDAQQSGDYIHTRLTHAGLVGDSPFTTPVVDGIHHDSGGLPGAIHPLALNTLLASSDMAGGGRRPSTRAVAWVALALLIGAGLAWFLRPALEPAPEQTATAQRDPAATGRVQGRAPEPVPAPSAPEPVTEPAFVGSVTAKPDGADGPEGVLVPATAGDGVKVTTLKEGTIDARPMTRPAVAVASPSAAKAASPTDPRTPPPGLDGNVTPATGISAPAADAGTPRDADWLRTRDPTHYVLQLVGTRDSAAASRFLDTHGLGPGAEKAGDKVGLKVATTHQGKPWYVVVYGVYPTRDAAREAIATLPEPLRSGTPWPRTVGSVVADLR